MSIARRLSTDWVLPIDGPPIPGGAVLIDSTGRIAAVGRDADVSAPPEVPAEHLPGAALLPGFVNAHTHLELTGLADPAPERDFAEWIRRLRQRKAERSADDFLLAARQGLRDCWAAGVTTIADTGDSGAALHALADAGGSGIAYLELFGPHPDQAGRSMAAFADRIAQLRPRTSERAGLGVSPHAPYSVSGSLYAAAAQFAEDAGLPLAVHVAESAAESALLSDGTGAFADLWRGRGVPVEPPECSPVEWLDRHGVLGPHTLCIHVVRASAADIARLAGRGAAVAHCPLSNARHRHGAAPLRRLLDAGVPVGLGTDSVASVGCLDLLAEARAARGLAALDARGALELATIGAARAIGLADAVGSLVVGKWGDVVAVEIGAAVTEPAEAVLASGAADVRGTWLGGKSVFRGPVATVERGPGR